MRAMSRTLRLQLNKNGIYRFSFACGAMNVAPAGLWLAGILGWTRKETASLLFSFA